MSESEQLKLDQTLMPIRIDKPLKDELARVSELLGLSKSQIVRAAIFVTIQKPSQIETIIEEENARIDAWYEKHKESNNNGDKKSNGE